MEVNTANDNSIYLSPGTVLRSQYRINRVIGQGGFGITYDGTDLKLNMHVAIKEYFPNPVASRNSTLTKEVTCSQNTRELYEHGLKNFLEEARNMARFAGEENFVAVHDYFYGVREGAKSQAIPATARKDDSGTDYGDHNSGNERAGKDSRKQYDPPRYQSFQYYDPA